MITLLIVFSIGAVRSSVPLNRIVDGVTSHNVGPIIIKEDGVEVTRYLVSSSNYGMSTNGSAAYLNHDTAGYIVKNASFDNNFSPDMFVEYKLNGKTLSFTTDLSEIECSCNAALFFASMPGFGSNGKPDPGKNGDYTCNANDDVLCWEMDTVESNKYAIQVTPHQCDAPPGQYASDCDHGGCSTNGWYADNKGFGPDSSFKINTQYPFRQTVKFGSNITIILNQGSNTFQFEVCTKNSSYIESMNAPFEYGMAMILCYWGDSYSEMQWLDSMTGCKGDCPGTGHVIYSDIEIA